MAESAQGWVRRGLRRSCNLVQRPSLSGGLELNRPMHPPTKRVRNAKSWRGWTRLPVGSINNPAVGIAFLERGPVMLATSRA